MGLIGWRKFSSIPTFQDRSKAVQKEIDQTILRHEDEIGRVYFSDAKSSTNGIDQIIFTVPANTDFILLTAFIQFHADNASGGGVIQIETNNQAMPIVLSTITPNPGAGEVFLDSMTMNYGRGLRFKGGDRFTLTAGSNQQMVGGISGFVIDAKLK